MGLEAWFYVLCYAPERRGEVIDHLRGYQERASAYVLDALGLQWTEGQWPPRLKQSEPADTSAEKTPSINELVPA